MVTAETVTDEQIRALMWELEAEHNWCDRSVALMANTLPEHNDSNRLERARLRARCAEIINARGSVVA